MNRTGTLPPLFMEEDMEALEPKQLPGAEPLQFFPFVGGLTELSTLHSQPKTLTLSPA